MKAPDTPQGRLASDLYRAISARDPVEVRHLFEPFDPDRVGFDASHPEAAFLVDMLARCVDFDWLAAGWADRVAPLLERCTALDVGDLQCRARAHLTLAGGILRFHQNDYKAASDELTQAMRLAAEINDRDLTVVAGYYLARCQWKRGDYDNALDSARQSVDADPRPRRRAVTQMVLAWLYFLKGFFDAARAVLKEAEDELLQTTDYVNHGNILSFQGRLSRLKEQANAAETEQSFKDSIVAYQRADPRHRNIARCYTNLAMHYRCQAQDVLAKGSSWEHTQRAKEHWAHARSLLTKAAELYSSGPQQDPRGRGTMENISALLYLDEKRLGQAGEAAEQAYRIGANAKEEDHVVMANARVISSLIALKERAVPTAFQHSEKARLLAAKTDNRRLQARAWLTQARVLLERGDCERASELCADAYPRLKPEEQDYLRAEYEHVKRLVDEAMEALPSVVVCTITRKEVGDGTLDAIMERAENAVIATRWMQNACNQALTAQQLGIGPNRVRDACDRMIVERWKQNGCNPETTAQQLRIGPNIVRDACDRTIVDCWRQNGCNADDTAEKLGISLEIVQDARSRMREDPQGNRRARKVPASAPPAEASSGAVPAGVPAFLSPGKTDS